MPSKAVTRDIELAVATCPKCGCGRYFSKDEKKIRPLVPNRFELKRSSLVFTNEFQCDEVTAVSVKFNSAKWEIEEHANKVVCRLTESGGSIIEKLDVLSNTEDTLILKFNQKIQPFSKESILDSKNKPFYAFLEEKDSSYKLAVDKYYDKNILVCECGEEYTVA